LKNSCPFSPNTLFPEAFFDHALQKGVFEPAIPSQEEGEEPSAGSLFDPAQLGFENGSADSGTEVVLVEDTLLGSGQHANNPWLQELPDPVAKICWDNFAAISPLQARELNLQEGDVIRLLGVEIPVHIQPGQAYGTIGIALGYGRRSCGVVGRDCGHRCVAADPIEK